MFENVASKTKIFLEKITSFFKKTGGVSEKIIDSLPRVVECIGVLLAMGLFYWILKKLF